MPTTTVLDPNAGVAKIFNAIVSTLEKLRWQQEAPDCFLVYAHDNDTISQPADANIARRIIEWLRQVGANISSDRTGMGNPPIPKATPSDTANAHDILSSQLGLLPTNHFVRPEDKRQRIILCGSALLGHYIASDYYQHTYYPGFKAAYQSTKQQAHPADARRVLSNYVNSQLNTDGFHHVLTELACLQLRNESEPDRHCIVPIALNDCNQAIFPDFIRYSTTIRILDVGWKDQKTYQDQALHEGFFRVLDRLWEPKMRIIQIIAKDVYSNCLTALATQRLSEQTLTSVILEAMQDAQQRLIDEGSATLQMLSNQAFLQEIKTVLIAENPNSLTLDTLEIYEALEKTLGNRLQIKRVCGDPLRISQCYINLAIIEHQVNRARDEGKAMRTQGFDRLSSDEAIPETNIAKRIPLEELFKPRRLKGGKEDIPRRILIRGRAGIGKTTLAKKSVYGYLQEGLWNDQFNWVLWIPLRHLKGEAGNYQLQTLLYEEYFKGYDERGRTLAQALYQSIQQDPLKTLLILDGWDEVSQEETPDGLIALLNHPSVIITSRPYGISFGYINEVDLELETVGFNQENVMKYLDHPDIVDSEAAKAIKAFIWQHPFVRELVNIPIQLDALCYSWDEIQEAEEVTTMTSLYEAIVTKLWRKDMVKLKATVDGKRLTETTVQDMLDDEIIALIEKEQHVVGALALNGLVENRIEFTQHHSQSLVRQLQQADLALSINIRSTIKQLSCLQVDKHSSTSSLLRYTFIHLTFQEFFAAQWLVSCFKQDTPLHLQENPAMKAQAFIQQHKYNPRYEIMWRFVAGLWPKEILPSFFNTLEQGAQDLIGIQHQHLIIHCFKETTGKLPTVLQEELESKLVDWLMFDIAQQEVYQWIPSLACQYAFPEALVLAQLEKDDVSDQVKNDVLRILIDRHTVSQNAIRRLMSLVDDKNKNVKYKAIMTLGKVFPGSPECIQTLTTLLEDEDWYLAGMAALALGDQSLLSPQIIQSLIACLESKSRHVRWSAAEALGKQSLLTSSVIYSLIDLFKHKERDVQEAAIHALGKSPLPPDIIQLLITRLEDENEDVIKMTIHALGKSPLPIDIIQLLITRLEDENREVRQTVIQALGQQSPLPQESVQPLIARLKDEDQDVMKAAIHVLGKSPLPTDIIQLLITRLEDENREVRQTVIQALGQQSPLPQESVQPLIARLKDEDQDVMKAAIHALGKSPLPPGIIQLLITRLEDENPEVKQTVIQALGQQPLLPLKAIQLLIDRLEDEARIVGLKTKEALEQQSPLLPEAIEALITRLTNKEWMVRKNIVEVLGKQSPLSPKIIQSLLARLQDQHGSVRWAVVEALQNQSYWDLYHFTYNSPARFNQLYRLYFLPSQLARISSVFYLHENVLYFNEAGQLTSVSLDESIRIQLKQSILQAQIYSGIPLVSRIKVSNNPTDSLAVNMTRQDQEIDTRPPFKRKSPQFFQHTDNEASSSQHKRERHYI